MAEERAVKGHTEAEAASKLQTQVADLRAQLDTLQAADVEKTRDLKAAQSRAVALESELATTCAREAAAK